MAYKQRGECHWSIISPLPFPPFHLFPPTPPLPHPPVNANPTVPAEQMTWRYPRISADGPRVSEKHSNTYACPRLALRMEGCIRRLHNRRTFFASSRQPKPPAFLPNHITFVTRWTGARATTHATVGPTSLQVRRLTDG